MPRILFIITYMGQFPWYFPYFLHSCRYNPTIDFLIFTDNNEPNIEYEERSNPVKHTSLFWIASFLAMTCSANVCFCIGYATCHW
jgi:hypothetical protein